MKILLIDDHELFREGLKLLLANLDENLSFIEAGNLAQALAAVDSNKPDIVLLDYHMPGINGLDALKLLRESLEGAVIVVLSAEEDTALIRSVIEQGAAGLIPKRSSHAVMMAALRLVLAGGVYLPAHLIGTNPETASRGHAQSPAALAGLTERQIQVLKRTMQGKANKVIAREMDISEATVKAHLSAAFRALGVHSRTEAVFAAAAAGLSA